MSTAIPTGWAVRPTDLALYVQVDGILTDAHLVEYRIHSKEDGSPTDWVDVTESGHFATGVYGVLDADGDPIEFAEEIYDGYIEWRYLILGDDAFPLYVRRPFEVLSSTILHAVTNNIFRIADIRSVEELSTHSDRALFEIASFWTRRIEMYTRQKFWPDYSVLKFRVRGTVIQPPLELFALGAVYLDKEEEAEEIEDVFTYVNTHKYGNPTIEMTDTACKSVARITAVWGVVDPDTLSAPLDLAMTASRVAGMVSALEGDGGDGGTVAFAVGPLRREKTDTHEVEYATVSSAVKTGMLSLLKSPELRDQLDLYRAPLAISMVGG